MVVCQLLDSCTSGLRRVLKVLKHLLGSEQLQINLPLLDLGQVVLKRVKLPPD